MAPSLEASGDAIVGGAVKYVAVAFSGVIISGAMQRREFFVGDVVIGDVLDAVVVRQAYRVSSANLCLQDPSGTRLFCCFAVMGAKRCLASI